MTTVIQANGLFKSYGGVRALSGIDLEVRQGEVFGYLGPNGAGKTTTIRLLFDLIRPTSGSASVFGLDTRTHGPEIRARAGYLSGDIALYDRLTGRELLTYLANLRGGVDWRYVDELVQRLDADPSRPVRALSRGNRQKIGLVQALMNRPELVVMDEPSSGLDPLVQQEFHRLVGEVRADGRTVFISSHVLPEVERVCDRVAIIREGELLTVEEVETLKDRAVHKLEFRFSAPVPEQAFADLPGVRDVVVTDSTVSCTVIGRPDALIKAAARFEVVKVVSHEPHLEDIFLSYYGQGDGHAE